MIYESVLACKSPCLTSSRAGCVINLIWSIMKLPEQFAKCVVSLLNNSPVPSQVRVQIYSFSIPTDISSVLQLFLASPKPTLKFAAIRTLSALAVSHPSSVATCNLDMENLISDSNRSIATYAITTLLKTGNEASVDRLMKQISGFMSEISDEFKVIVVDAIRSLCLKFPAKQALMLNFLSGTLRDEGGYEFKRAVVEAIFDMIRYIPDSKESALAHLCEFIEDCEFTKLSVRVLYLLGVEGPKTLQPAKFIRYIYNRVVLENAIVRAAAVASLAKFGVNVKDLTVKRSIVVLLSRCVFFFRVMVIELIF